MADNSLQGGADTIRDKDRAGVKTQVFGIDMGIGTGTENLMAGSMPISDSLGAAVQSSAYGSQRVSDEARQVFYDPFDAVLDTTTLWTSGSGNSGVAASVTTGLMTIATGTVASGYARLNSQPTFKLPIPGWMGFSFALQLPDMAAPIANSLRFWGCGTIPSVPTTTTPVTDGVGFEMTTAGHLCCVVYAAGTRTQVADLFGGAQPTTATMHRYIVQVRTDKTYFYIDGTSSAQLVASSNFQAPNVQTLPESFVAVGGSTPPASSAQIQCSGAVVWDTGKNATQIADGVYPFRKATVSAFGALSVVDTDATATGTLTALNSTVALTTGGIGTGIFEITGTWVGTITFEGSNNNFTTSQAVTAIYLGGIQTNAATTTTNGYFSVMTAGFAKVQARMSAYTSGTATVTANGSQAERIVVPLQGNPNNHQVLATLNAGTAVVGKFTTDQTTHGTTDLVAGDITKVGGTAVDANSGVKSAGTLRVVLATDQPALSNKLLVTPDSVALPANQSVNTAQVAGTATSVNNGTTDAGTTRVTLSSDSTGQVKVTDGTQLANTLASDTGQNALLVAGNRKEVSFTTTTVQAVASTDVSNYRWVSVQINAQGTSSVVTWQVSNDNVNWFGVSLAANTSLASQPTLTSSTTGIWHGPLSGRYFRLNVTGISSGTTSGVIEFGAAPAGLTTMGVVAGQNGTWTTQIGNTPNTTAILANPLMPAVTTTGDTGAKTVTFNGATQTNANAAGALIVVNMGTVTGTTPTCVVKVQESADGGTTWVDTPGATTASLVATGVWGIKVYPGVATTAGTTTTGTTATVSQTLARTWRLVYTIGGTTPSFTLTNVQVSYII